MSLVELKKYTFRAKYSSYNPDKKRRETWQECVSRSENMMLRKYAGKNIDEIIKKAYGAAKRKEVLGAQRALQFAGPAIEVKNARLYNCSSTYADRPKFFQEAMYLLLCGCGVGFSVQQHHVSRLPKLVKELEGRAKYSIPDTIEGWADAIGILVNSYLQSGLYPDYEGKVVDFDYSKIRPAGSKLSYTTGKAPGPEPLKAAIAKIRKLLNSTLEAGQTKLKPIQVYDIVMHSSDAVLAGGVRRSATICLFSPEDSEMLTAKTGNWFNENPQRGRSNNSVVLLRNATTKEQFDNIMKCVKECGEPGFVWVDSLESGFNPCVEINFFCYDIVDEAKFNKWQEENGPCIKLEGKPEKIGLASGWEFCNLSTINGAKATTREVFLAACVEAAVIGTLQAGFTDFPYLEKHTENIVKREALLGVSITGVMENPQICLNEGIQREGAALIIKTNEEIAKLIGINAAARTTCIKPEGTTSCILGTSSGIHPHHAKRYIRRVQATKLEPLYQYFNKLNPDACENSVWSANDSDDVISFCISVQDGAKTKNQLKAVDLLTHVRETQKNWVTYGRVVERCTQPWLNHNVSNTITIREGEWDEVANFIYDNRQYFCGISLLPESGDKDYPQAPFTTIYTPKEMINHYGDGAMFVSGLIETSLELYDDNLWAASDVLNGINGKITGAAKKDWFARCKSFADKYLGGDVKKLTYLMKDIYNWKKWLDLNRTYKAVDYDSFLENEDEVEINFSADSACAGGTCEIIRT
jgi:ribonucleoside-triphosphate reductase